MIFYVEKKRKKGEHSLIVDSIIKSLVEKHPDLLNSFEGGNWEDFLNGVYPDDVEIIVLRNIVEYAHFNEYLPEEVVLLKKENFYTLGERFLDGEQGYEVPLLEGEEKVADETVVPKRSKSSKNKKKKRNKLYYLLYFLIFLSVVILGIFLVLNGSTAQEVSQKDVPKLPAKTEKKVENKNKNKDSESKKESEKKSETTSSEPKKEESESNPKPANSQTRNSSSSTERRSNSTSNQEVGSTSTPAQPSNNAPAPSSTEKPTEAPTKEEPTSEKPSVEEKLSEEPKETPKEEKKEEAKEEPTFPSGENKNEDGKNPTLEKDKKE